MYELLLALAASIEYITHSAAVYLYLKSVYMPCQII